MAIAFLALKSVFNVTSICLAVFNASQRSFQSNTAPESKMITNIATNALSFTNKDQPPGSLGLIFCSSFSSLMVPPNFSYWLF
jgi:hypothetical protein